MTGMNNTVSFGQKLDWLKRMFNVKDREIGAAVNVSDALVCRWRNGERTLVRVRDENVLNNLAGFFAGCARQTEKVHILAQALELGDSDITEKNEDYRNAFICFLFDENPIQYTQETGSSQGAPNMRRECYTGKEGLLNSLALLENRLQGNAADITVYLSLEHTRSVLEDSADKIWDMLWRMGGGNPVRLVLDNWTDAGEASKTLRGLLPFMQTGRIRFCLVKSTQKFFFSNISFYAAGVGIVVTADPVGGFGGSVSMLVESPDYLKGMGSVYARFDKIIKNVEKHLSPAVTKDEAAYYGQLFDPGSDIKTVMDGADLLYMDVDAYLRLLKLNGVAGSQRAYRLDRFIKDKLRFEELLASNRVTEIFSLPTFDRMISSRKIITPDFSFHAGAIKADKDVLSSLFAGMLDYLARYENLSVYINRQKLPYDDFSCRLKGDSFVLLHSYGDGAPHAVWSDTWLLVYEYMRQFDEILQGSDLITTRNAVKSALRIRLEI